MSINERMMLTLKYSAKVKEKKKENTNLECNSLQYCWQNISDSDIYIDIDIYDQKLSGPMSKMLKNKIIFLSNNSKQKNSKIQLTLQ